MNYLRSIAFALAGTLIGVPAWAAYMGSPPLLVPNGGTGATTFTAHNVVLGEGTAALGVAAPGSTSGVPLISQGTSADPVFGTVAPAGGGTGLTSLTAHGLLVGEGTSNATVLTPAADSIPLWQSATADPTVTAINNCTSALTYSTSTHTFGCNGATGWAPSESTVTGSSPFTIATTNGLTTVISMATPAAATANLPAAQAAGWIECIKDGTTNFATNNLTVKVSSGNIDNVSGTTGFVMNQAKESACFQSDGTNYWIE